MATFATGVIKCWSARCAPIWCFATSPASAATRCLTRRPWAMGGLRLGRRRSSEPSHESCEPPSALVMSAPPPCAAPAPQAREWAGVKASQPSSAELVNRGRRLRSCTPSLPWRHGSKRNLSSAGKAVMFISHNLDDIFAVADRILVLRPRQKGGERRAAETNNDETCD
jgi:hypothetical protein